MFIPHLLGVGTAFFACLSMLTGIDVLAESSSLNAVVSMTASSSSESTQTYCNPISLADYPIGRSVREGSASAVPIGARGQRQEQFRELADPTALWYEGKWYLYPSCEMAWVSADEGLTWTHHSLNVPDIGYAPTIVRHGGEFWLTATGLDLYRSASPLGPFTKVGKIALPKMDGLPGIGDPMLFSDDDGRLFLYWGCSPRNGIWMMELDAKNPLVGISTPVCLIPFRPDIHPWEALGNWNQNPKLGWLEGAWMLKHKGRYYLTYSAAGTEFRSYAMGCYVSDHPEGPFVPQKHNPILRTVDGLITGTAHGCIVAGPRNRLWAFYSIRAVVDHKFERRIGFDLAAVDDTGELTVPCVSTSPQCLPPVGDSSNSGYPSGWLPLNDGGFAAASSSAENLPARLAVDNNLTTWWQPAKDDANPILTTDFSGPASVRAVRIIWRDIGLDTRIGAIPGPFRYRVEVEERLGSWTVVLDRSSSTEDLLIDYRQCFPVTGRRARLIIVGHPKGITPGVAEFTVFGSSGDTR